MKIIEMFFYKLFFKEKKMDYISEVQRQGKYGPTPPEMIAYPLDPSDVDLEPIIWRRRSTTYDFDSYHGGYGQQENSIQLEPERSMINEKDFPTVPDIKVPWLLPFIIRNDENALKVWIYAYLLNEIPLNPGLYYLEKIHQESATYTEEIHYAIKAILDRPQIAGSIANQLGLYLPKTIRGDPIPFIYESVYWLRQFRSEEPRLSPILDDMTPIDLYLVTPNPYQLFPGRKLLSYYPDDQLYYRFGRIGNEYLSKNYISKRAQLDSFVAMTMKYYGYFKIVNWSRPIQLIFFSNQQKEISLNLNEVFERKDLPPIAILRLGIEVYASWPQIKDPAGWQPFLTFLETHAADFYNLYLNYKLGPPFTENTTKDAIIHSVNETSLEAPLDQKAICQVCRVVRSIDEFSLCGHPICLVCVALLNTASCPFCHEHVTANKLNENFIQMDLESVSTNQDLLKRVDKVREDLVNRTYKFNWSTLNVSLFGLK
jgi:hypothetical protein